MNESVEIKRKRIWPFSIPLTFTIILIDLVLFGAAYVYWLNLPDTDFPTESTITIEPGMSVSTITALLAEQNIVKSDQLLYAILVLEDYSTKIKASTYRFSEPLTTKEVAERLATGEFSNDLTTVTIPEGFSVREIDSFLPDSLVDSEVFQVADEGFLFPDTYFVPSTFTAADLRTLMQETLRERLAEIEYASSSTYTTEELITFASLVEREANTPESMRLVAGILQNRLDIGMALQVDASVAYGLKKSGTLLTREDLTIDGPYNTYTRAGLPIGPIANPGLEAIKAVLNPEPSEYFYYITGNDGNFYYATTLDEHNLNVARYLR